MPRGVFLHYPIHDTVVDAVAETVNKHRRARDLVNERHMLTASCSVDLTATDYDPTLIAYMQESREGCLEPALFAYFAFAGIPDFVESDSDFAAVENVLGRYGKSLKRKFLGFLSGRYVVDAPTRVASEA